MDLLCIAKRKKKTNIFTSLKVIVPTASFTISASWLVCYKEAIAVLAFSKDSFRHDRATFTQKEEVTSSISSDFEPW